MHIVTVTLNFAPESMKLKRPVEWPWSNKQGKAVRRQGSESARACDTLMHIVLSTQTEQR